MCYSVLNVVLLWSLTGVRKELCWKYSLHFLPLYLPVQLEANQDQHEPKILCFILIPEFIDVMKTESNSVTSGNNDACNYRQISCCVLVDWAVLGLLKDVTVSCSCTLGRRRRPSGWRQRLSCKSSWKPRKCCWMSFAEEKETSWFCHWCLPPDAKTSQIIVNKQHFTLTLKYTAYIQYSLYLNCCYDFCSHHEVLW